MKGANLMELLRGTANEGVHTDYSYTDRYELDLSGKAQLTAAWDVGAALADTGRSYDYDAIGNRTGDQAGAYTVKTGYPGAPSSSAAVNEYLHTPYDGGAAATYDLNGNLLTDGIRTCEYDGENRLTKVTQSGTVLEFQYDYLGRRISKKVNGAEKRFLYDGWNLIAELDPAGAILRKFVWGLDVSGTFQGAGGVGGLLLIEDGANRYYPIYDASHNVIGLYNQSGAIAAAYEYDPFGNVTASGGTYAASNPFRFSTKFTDVETDLIYYGHRYYVPLTGRFFNRDPIAEAGGLNLYGFCGNDGVNRWDYLGMETRSYVVDGVTVYVTNNASEVPQNAIILGQSQITTTNDEERDGAWQDSAEASRSNLWASLEEYSHGSTPTFGDLGKPTIHGYFYDDEAFDWGSWDRAWEGVLAQGRAELADAEAELAWLNSIERKSFGRELYEGAVYGDFAENTGGGGIIAQTGVGFVPILGQIADARDTVAAVKALGGGGWRRLGTYAGLGAAVVGWVPGMDWVKAGKNVAKAAKKPVVIGESMKARVIPRAEGIGGHYYKPKGEWTLEKNKRWAEDMKRQVDRGERKLEDIGLDPERKIRSTPYQEERKIFYPAQRQ